MDENILNQNIAVIDLGSNSLRMQIATVFEKSYKIVCEYKDLIRIGDDLFQNGKLTKNSISKLNRSFMEIKTLMDSYNVVSYRAVATATLRSSPNGGKIIEDIHQKSGIKVEIIDGEDEAKLSFLGVKSCFNLKKYNSLITDIGGGSSEFILSEKGEIKSIMTKKLGGARIKHNFLKNDPPEFEEVETLKHFIRKELSDLSEYDVDVIICTGGTSNNLSTVAYLREKKDHTSQIKYTTRDFLRSFINEIKRKKISSISKIKGVEEKRADLLLPIAIQIDQILELTGRSGFYTFSGGLRTGLIIDTLNRYGIHLPFQTLEIDVNQARLIEIGNKFHFNEEHALKVSQLAVIIFDKLHTQLGIQKEFKEILHAAAVLHDIGNFISLSKHHLHSEYLILNTDLTGFNSYERAIISQIARYHRKRFPKKTDPLYSLVKKKDIEVTLKLAAILRVADALDRTHKGKVEDIQIEIIEDNIIFKPIHQGDISMEKSNFDEKKDFLEKYTGFKVTIV
ncbi:HD domain-containing protein [Calditerrivibrio sp.]|uniref:Ppx/GppA phosphatase family protein n=1 Tax=Calditerrivibrio sp. TaxID=2792612 RepID=UPI003D0A4DDA